jgi:DNA-binding response OmpR family regulator
VNDETWVDLARSTAGRGEVTLPLSASAVSVLGVFAASGPRVVSRLELGRRAGLTGLSERRCDGIIVELRRALGHDAIVTVRSRGWRCVEPPLLVSPASA